MCKWNYRSGTGDTSYGWSSSFLKAIGLDELLSDDAIKIGRGATEPGRPCRGGKEHTPALIVDM